MIVAVSAMRKRISRESQWEGSRAGYVVRRQESGNEATTSLLGNDGSCSYPSLVSPQWLSRFPFDRFQKVCKWTLAPVRTGLIVPVSGTCQFRSVRTYNDSRVEECREDIAFVFHTTVVEPNPQSRCQRRGSRRRQSSAPLQAAAAIHCSAVLC